MAWGNPDVYHEPEDFGLEVVASLSDPEADYSFDDVIVWRRVEDGRLFWASDSGCSCPSPFEDFTSVESLNPLPETARDLEGELRRTRGEGRWVAGEWVESTQPFWDAGEVLEFRRRVGL